MDKIFISYSRKDQEFVEFLKPIFKRLNIEEGVLFYQDVENLKPGEDFESLVKENIEDSNIVLCFLSANFFASSFIQNKELPLIEIMYSRGQKIIPLFIEEVYINEGSFLDQIQRINWANYLVELSTEEDKANYKFQFEKDLRDILTISNSQNIQLKKRYNIVVVGKAGVGKSELVNYLFGEKIVDSGIGPPITELGFHRTNINMGNIPACIWDSAGLEVGKHEEWIKELQKELTRRGPTEAISEWFHTVLYCVQSVGSRIEDFEIEIIKKFQEQKYTVIVVLTKAFINKKKIDELKVSIQKKINTTLKFVYVNSVSEEIGDTIIKKRGRLELFKEIEYALVNSLTERVPNRCIKIMQKEIEKKGNKLIAFIDDNIGVKTKNQISEYVKMELEKLVGDIKSEEGRFQQIINNETKNTLNLYSKITGLLGKIIALNDEENPLKYIENHAYVSKTSTFWEHLEDGFNDLYDWDASNSVGELADIVLKIVSFPLITFGSVFGAVFEYIEDQMSWESNLKSNISSKCEELKNILDKNYYEIELVFKKKVKEILG